jgi:membrane associated rhomboid family serine protease
VKTLKRPGIAMLPIRDNVPRQHLPVATWSLIFLNFVVFFFELTLPPDTLQQLFYWFGIVPARVTHPEWASVVGLPLDDYWPLLTCMFLHGGWLHVISNMWALWIFGDNVEDRMGPGRFVTFYLLCGLAAGIVHTATNADSTLPTVGASGAIAGVMGAYFLLFPTARMVVMIPIFFFPFFFELPAILYIGFWALSQLFSGTLSLGVRDVGGIAWWAHVGGFLTGMALVYLFVRRGPDYRRLSRDEYGPDGAWLPARHWREA